MLRKLDHDDGGCLRSTKMKSCVRSIIYCSVVLILNISTANADIVVVSATPREKYTYTAKLPGEWSQVPAVSGTQLTYALTWGTPLARTCTFKSDDAPPEWDITTNEKAKNLSNSLIYMLRSNPERILHSIRQRVPNISLENFYTTYGEDNVKLTLVYSYDDAGIISGQKMTLRSIVYETQFFSTGVFIQVTCNMLRDSYGVDSEELFRKIRDSVGLQSR